MKADSVTIRRPDDWHVHLRDGAMLQAVLPWTASQFARGIVMPNLVPPVTTCAAATAYRDRIMAALPGETGAIAAALITAPATDAQRDNGILLTNLPASGWMSYAALAKRRSDLIMLKLIGNPDGSSAVDYTVNSASGFAPGPCGSMMAGILLLGKVPTNSGVSWSLVWKLTRCAS